MATATRAKRTSTAAPAPSVTTVDGMETVFVDVTPAVGDRLLGKLAEVNDTRKRMEKAEKELKAEIRSLCPDDKLTEGRRYAIRIRGHIRGFFNWRSRTNIDTDLLLQAFPEAFEACRKTSEYEQFDPR